MYWEKKENHTQVSSLAFVDSEANLGARNKVWHFANVCQGVETKEDVVIGSAVYVGAHVKIGEGTRVQDKAHLTDRMIIGKRVFIGPCAVTMNDLYPRLNNPDYKVSPPILDDDCVIGAGAVLLPGIKIGKFAIVGAGAVVIRDVKPYHVVFGNPARSTLRTDIEIPDEYKNVDEQIKLGV
mgnify:FL=1